RPACKLFQPIMSPGLACLTTRVLTAREHKQATRKAFAWKPAMTSRKRACRKRLRVTSKLNELAFVATGCCWQKWAYLPALKLIVLLWKLPCVVLIGH